MRRATIFLSCLAAALLVIAPQASAKRVAFVVGVDAYDNLPAQEQLQKAVNDAHALGETLKGLGYQVVSADNADRRGFNESWQKFLSAIEPGDETAFFFAGHGVEISGQNYLLPRDVPKPQSGEASLIKNESLSVTQLLDDLQDKSPRVSLVILDACRDNPFAADGTRSVGGTRGLARVEAPEGTFVMYSAGAGQTALDRLSDSDADANSVFTRSLVPLIKTPGLRLQEVALKVREQVVELANSVGRKQTPAYYDQVIGRFCVAGCETALAEAKPESVPPPAPLPAASAPAAPPNPQPQVSAAPAEPVPAPSAAAPPAPAPSAPPQQQVAVLTPQAVERPVVPGHAPIHECDRLAGDPDNPDSVVGAVDMEDRIDTLRAVPACEEAVRDYPQERRFAFQLARAEIQAKKPELAKPLLERLSNDGYAIATAYLGYLYADGSGVAADVAEALRLYRQAAEAGDGLGALALASAYKDGRGVAKDEAEALRWLRKAADAGNASAMTFLADQYADGQLGLAKDDAEAASWYRKAADLGNARGVYDLALMYQDGRGLPKDEAEAARLFQKGDDLKSASAMTHVGLTYDIGRRVAKDESQSLRWYRKAADLGDADGMWFVAMAYRYGNGVTPDQAEAARWYGKAAALGQVTAMTSLAEMYEKGEGVSQDAAEAKRLRAEADSLMPPASAPENAKGEESKEQDKVAAVAPNESEAPSPPAAAVQPSSEPAEPAEKSAAIAPAELQATPADEHVGRRLRSFSLGQYDGPTSLAFTRDGKHVVMVASGGYFRTLDPATGENLEMQDEAASSPCCQVAVSPDGRYLATGNFEGMVLLWDAETLKLTRRLLGHSGHATAVAFSPDGKLLASGGEDKTVRLWDVESGELRHTLKGHSDNVLAVAFSPDGKRLASGGSDHSIRLWDVAAGRLSRGVGLGEAGTAESLAFTSDGKFLAVKDVLAHDIQLIDPAKAKILRSIGVKGSYDVLESMAVSPDGKTIATGGNDKVVRLFDVATGKQLQTFEEHGERVEALAFSPDGTTLASGDAKVIKLWDLEGLEVAEH